MKLIPEKHCVELVSKFSLRNVSPQKCILRQKSEVLKLVRIKGGLCQLQQ
jgi:hypothetical protein